MLAVATQVAGYRIDGVLGHGGMGTVYAATQLSLNRAVALKILSPEPGQDASFRERFRREGEIQAGIDHPHIIPVYEAGEIDEGLFIAMRMVRGATLKELIDQRDLDAARALALLAQVADALDAAHEADLIHRDIKPQNILVDTRDHAYLADFGLTKVAAHTGLTKTGHFMGTLDYISPEQIRGEPIGPASDLYALGGVLYECLTGVVPFPKSSDAAVLFSHMSDPPPSVVEQRSDLPEALDAVISKAMSKAPDDRYPTARAMLDDARLAFDGSVPESLSPPAPPAAPEEIGIRRSEGRVETQQRPRRRVRALDDVVAPEPLERDLNTQPPNGRPAVPGPPPQPVAAPAAHAPARDASIDRDYARIRPRSATVVGRIPGGRHWRLVPVAVLAVVGIAVAAILIAGGGDGSSGTPVAQAGPIRVAPGAGWSAVAPVVPELESLAGDEVASLGRTDGSLVFAGRLVRAPLDRLDAPFSPSLGTAEVTKSYATLGGKPVVHYSATRRADGLRLEVFQVLTAEAALVVGCRVPKGVPVATACAPVTGGTTVDTSVLDQAPDAALGQRLAATLSALSAAGKRRADDLKAARLSTRAQAADELSDVQARAAKTVRQLQAGALDSRAVDELGTALVAASKAFHHLAVETGSRGRQGYADARPAALHANGRLSDALDSLRVNGYRSADGVTLAVPATLPKKPTADTPTTPEEPTGGTPTTPAQPNNTYTPPANNQQKPNNNTAKPPAQNEYGQQHQTNPEP